MVECRQRLTKVTQDVDDVVAGGQRRADPWIVQISDKFVDGLIDICRRAATFRTLGVIGNQSDRECVGGFKQQLPAQKVTIAIINVFAILRISVKTVAFHVNAVDAERELLANRSRDARCRAHEIIIAVCQFATAAKGEAWLL